MKKKILIADDNSNVRITLSDILEEMGYEVIVADSGKEALKLAKAERPALAVIDVLMPDMSGNEACKKIKETMGNKIKVIVYTASVDAVDAGKARAAGADDYIVKTEDFSHMLSAIKKFMK